MVGSCEHCDELLGSKRQGISQLSEELLTSEEGLAAWSWLVGNGYIVDM